MKTVNNTYCNLNNKSNLRDLGIYIHIPFCAKKCDYCDFLSAPADEKTKRRYIEALLIQIHSYQGKTDEYIVPTIFIGGGTPFCLEAVYIKEIMDTLKEVFHIDDSRLEATIEVNPGTVSQEKLTAYRQAGFNRLSFGLQSTDNNELKLLGRIHTYDQFLVNYSAARESGFQNINIDLMSALPGQTVASWEKTLNQVIELSPEHISAYSLIIEEGTPFYERYGEKMPGEGNLPDEDTDRLIYHKTKEILKANGYHRYEISNYAREGFECRHNSSYWTGTQYLGFGLGASSLLLCDESEKDNHLPIYERFSIENNLEEYIRLNYEFHQSVLLMQSTSVLDNIISAQPNMEVNSKPLEHIPVTRNFSKLSQYSISGDPIGLMRDIQILTTENRMEEFMFLGLRLCKGVSKGDFFERFHITIEDIYGDIIKKLISQKLLQEDEDRLMLTDYGIDVSNVVLSEFLLDE